MSNFYDAYIRKPRSDLKCNPAMWDDKTTNYFEIQHSDKYDNNLGMNNVPHVGDINNLLNTNSNRNRNIMNNTVTNNIEGFQGNMNVYSSNTNFVNNNGKVNYNQEEIRCNNGRVLETNNNNGNITKNMYDIDPERMVQHLKNGNVERVDKIHNSQLLNGFTFEDARMGTILKSMKRLRNQTNKRVISFHDRSIFDEPFFTQ